MEAYYQKRELSLTRVHGCLYTILEIVNGVKESNQDWGEAHFWADEWIGQPTQLWDRDAAKALHHFGRRVRDGQTLTLDWEDFDRKVAAVERLRKWRTASGT